MESMYVSSSSFSPSLKYASRFIAATHDSHVQVWKTPNHLIREFAPFELHRTYTGHHDEVLSIQWSADSRSVSPSTWIYEGAQIQNI
jgi:periodic tryptophan protein 2